MNTELLGTASLLQEQPEGEPAQELREDSTTDLVVPGEMFVEIWRAVARSHELRDILRRWAESISRSSGGAVVGIWLHEACSSEVALQAVGGRAAAEYGDLLNFARADVDGILAAGAPKVLFELSADRRWRQQHVQLNLRGVVALATYPLFARKQVAGAVVVFFRDRPGASILRALGAAAVEMSRALIRLCAETELQRAHGSLRTILSAAPSGIVGLDMTGKISHWNRAAERLFGWCEREIVGKLLSATVFAHDADFQRVFGLAANGRYISEYETTGCRQGGSRREIGLAIVPQYENSAIVGVMAVFTDFSERNVYRRGLSLQSRTAKILSDVANENGVSRVLEAMCLTLGWTNAEYWHVNRHSGMARMAAAWKSNSSLLPTATIGEERTLCDECELVAQVCRSEKAEWRQRLPWPQMKGREPSGKSLSLTYDALAVPVRAPVGETTGLLMFLSDEIPEPDAAVVQVVVNGAEQLGQFFHRRRTEAALATAEANLRQSQKMEAIGLLAGGIAHDFNNLLTVIIGHSEIGQDELPDDTPLRELLREIEVAGKRAAALTRQLLAFSRKQAIDPVVFNINQHVAEMELMLRRLIGKEIDLEVSQAPDLFPVKADPGQFEQVLLNLAVNARDAMPNGGRLAIRTSNRHLDRPLWSDSECPAVGAFAVLTVADSGCGMDDQTRLRIFEPFFTTKKPGQGTGMGLATVFGIVKQSGGGITVDSTPGRGTIFEVFFPRTRDALSAWQVESNPTPIPGGTESILVVDDEASVRAVVASLLEVRGYHVLQAASGAEALEICRQHESPPDLVISDVIMPGMTGQELVASLAAAYPTMKFLQVSGFTGHRQETESASRATPFLQKPFTSEELARKVRAVFDS